MRRFPLLQSVFSATRMPNNSASNSDRRLPLAKIGRLILLPLLLLSAGSAFAELKIAVVNVQRAIGECNEAKALIAKLESDTSSEQTAIKTLGADITQLQDKFNKNGDVMSEPEK